ncbi:hypothetical protein LV89_01580 [Arcicella aurantiaca]|uniref:Uncharacterized protein n=2 Tax=Arcicella aurantiaca TaxID=591202 RepID=A0A316EDI9_9BACT|nr:hypothetical protein LV89_01580 [Arcicella aurantiaca]
MKLTLIFYSMKNIVLSILLLGCIAVKAQSNNETLSFSGLVENPFALKINDLKQTKVDLNSGRV